MTDDLFPKGRIDRVIAPIYRYLQVETTSGVILIIATALALFWANFAGNSYHALWEMPLGISIGRFDFTRSLHWWINDGLMTLFFFVVGLEVKGEIINGELKNPKTASLPIIAALGGMIIPAVIYLMTCPPGTTAGWGVPMATDIAFVVGCMAI
ncbi:MAG TPA: Na+/H+ antiporter NhaA, partial [Fibrobacteraceae bacterium]|nr:Na+/H+ antiporter NhaA [Fibrobacteraceae bacterium]